MDVNIQYKCITCHVMFNDIKIQNVHFKCDWHRYNLKRKIADLPPLSFEDFQKRVNEHQTINKESNFFNCKICKKHFSSKNQYDNHLNSKKHKDQLIKGTDNNDTDEAMLDISKKTDKTDNGVAEMETDSEVESVDSDEWLENADNPTTKNDCIFCTHHSKSWVRNLKHMTEVHSFFIADLEYCIDIKGLIEYLGEKVYVGYMCIWCCGKGKAFQSAEAAQAHMIDKGHCKMLHEGENLIEYEDFYDYSSSYPDAAEADPDEEVEVPLLENGEYQLVLPSGAVIGHRSLMRYYKQNLNSKNIVCLPKNQKLKKIISLYKALGWKGNDQEVIAKKARDIKYMHRIQARLSTKLQFKQNKFQPHFRQQVNF